LKWNLLLSALKDVIKKINLLDAEGKKKNIFFEASLKPSFPHFISFARLLVAQDEKKNNISECCQRVE
jgi:hypothetical protein